jgi:putative PIN family toxin of toxin-antitoxin system
VRAVVDTNVLLSGLFWRGKPHALIEQVRAGALNLISSPGLLAELAEDMKRPKFEEILARSNTDAQRTLDELRRLARIIDPPPLPAAVSRDPSGDAVLDLVATSQADLTITRDAVRASRLSTRPRPSAASAARPAEGRRVWARVIYRPTQDRRNLGN